MHCRWGVYVSGGAGSAVACVCMWEEQAAHRAGWWVGGGGLAYPTLFGPGSGMVTLWAWVRRCHFLGLGKAFGPGSGVATLWAWVRRGHSLGLGMAWSLFGPG